MAEREREQSAGTVVFDPLVEMHAWLRGALPDWRAVPLGSLVGRDVLESPRLIVPDWRVFTRMDHVRELLFQRRGRTIVLAGLSGECVDAEGLAVLRRFAGDVLVLTSAIEAWTERLLVPVTSIEPTGLVAAIEAIAARPPVDMDAVEVHLREALAYVQASDDEGAFLAAARALALAPDQPGIVADVARLLARMGRSAEGQQLCHSFLRQRPDCAPVRSALVELQPADS